MKMWLKKYLWSVWYSLPGFCSETGIFFIRIGLIVMLYNHGVNTGQLFFILFLMILGGEQFSRETIEKMEKKFGKNNF